MSETNAWLSLTAAVVLTFLFFPGSPAMAQDPLQVDPAHYKLVYEDSVVRVLKVTLPPHETAERHSHPSGSVLHLTGNKATFTLAYSKFGSNDVKSGVVNELEEGAHAPENASDTLFEALIIEVKKTAHVRADAKPGQVEEVCAADAIPAGWVLVDFGDTDFTRCGGDFHNLRSIKKVDGLPAGATVTICKDSPVPAGWDVIRTFTDFTRCGNDLNNNKEIKRQTDSPEK
ncbi:MAG: hypothetical protein ACJ73D_09670 [Pyrinomonadaceae bacterium]